MDAEKCTNPEMTQILHFSDIVHYGMIKFGEKENVRIHTKGVVAIHILFGSRGNRRCVNLHMESRLCKA